MDDETVRENVQRLAATGLTVEQATAGMPYPTELLGGFAAGNVEITSAWDQVRDSVWDLLRRDEEDESGPDVDL